MSVSRLPLELLRGILVFLCQDDLRRAAAVCHAFYDSAWSSGLFIEHSFRWEQDKSCTAELLALSELVHHAVAKDLRISLTVTFHTLDTAGPPNQRSPHGSPFVDVLDLLAIAFPVLISLSLTFSADMAYSTIQLLSRPALHLRIMRLHFMDDDAAVPIVRRDIFAGVAPKLRTLHLHNIRVGQEPVAAFTRVQQLMLVESPLFPDIVLAQHFPVLRTLFISQESVLLSHVQAIPYNFQGLQLERLIVQEPIGPTLASDVICVKDSVHIPIVVSLCDKVEWTDSLWLNGNEPFSIRMTTPSSSHAADVSIFVVPAHRRWCRGYSVFEWIPNFAFPVVDLPALSARLTYLRMDNYYLIGFLDCPNLVLHALELMQIDFELDAPHSAMVWPPDWIEAFDQSEVSLDKDDESAPTFSKESYSFVDCPALKRLRLFAFDEGICVVSQEVAYLGRALSQFLRQKQERAVLELHGVEFRDTAPHVLVEESFSLVRLHAFTGSDGPLGREWELWEEVYVCY